VNLSKPDNQVKRVADSKDSNPDLQRLLSISGACDNVRVSRLPALSFSSYRIDGASKISGLPDLAVSTDTRLRRYQVEADKQDNPVTRISG
jgi:hypothetical protein